MRADGRAAGPVRLRLSRARGFRLQEHSRALNGLPAIVVSRPSCWGNPHRWQDCPSDIGPPEWARGAAVDLFREDLRAGRLRFTCEEAQIVLAGHNLACWCPLPSTDGEPDCCHAAVLLRLANAGRAALGASAGGDDA